MYHCLKYSLLKGNSIIFRSLLLMNYNVVTDRILNWQGDMLHSSFLSIILHSPFKNWYVNFAYLKNCCTSCETELILKLIQDLWKVEWDWAFLAHLGNILFLKEASGRNSCIWAYWKLERIYVEGKTEVQIGAMPMERHIEQISWG